MQPEFLPERSPLNVCVVVIIMQHQHTFLKYKRIISSIIFQIVDRVCSYMMWFPALWLHLVEGEHVVVGSQPCLQMDVLCAVILIVNVRFDWMCACRYASTYYKIIRLILYVVLLINLWKCTHTLKCAIWLNVCTFECVRVCRYAFTYWTL